MASRLRVPVIIVNSILLLFGLLTVALGFWTFLGDVDVINLANIGEDGTYENNFRSPGILEIMAWISIVVGVVVFFLAILAFFGVKKKSNWMLAVYSSILCLVFLLSLVTIALGGLMKDRIEKDLEGALNYGIVNQYEGIVNSENVFSYSYDQAQVQLGCCGVTNWNDFNTLNTTRWTDVGSLKIPKTCCRLDEYQYVYERIYVFTVSPDCGLNPNSTNSNIDNPCLDDIEDSLLTKTLVLLAIACVLAVTELLAIVLGCCLMRNTKDNPNADYKVHGYY